MIKVIVICEDTFSFSRSNQVVVCNWLLRNLEKEKERERERERKKERKKERERERERERETKREREPFT